MSIRYSSAAGAAVLLIATLCGSTSALAEGPVSAAVEVCTSGAVYRASGHPGKSMPMPRRGKSVQADCNTSAARSLMLVSFIDGAGGKALTSGDADRAIRQVSGRRPESNEALALNNLCVAHTALRQWADARISCDEAVAAAAKLQETQGRWPGERRRLTNKVAAAVYSNRAVMSWLSNDAAAAQGDFAHAQAIAPNASFVVRNAELAPRLPVRVEYAARVPVG